jgi:hypothetical protein
MRWLLAVAAAQAAIAVAGLAIAPQALAGDGWLGLVAVVVA